MIQFSLQNIFSPVVLRGIICGVKYCLSQKPILWVCKHPMIKEFNNLLHYTHSRFNYLLKIVSIIKFQGLVAR